MATESELKEKIVQQVNVTGDSNVEDQVDFWWSFYSEVATQAERFWRTRRDTLLYIQGQLRTLMDISSGSDSLKLSQQFSQVTQMLTFTQGQINLIDEASNSGAGTPMSRTPSSTMVLKENAVVVLGRKDPFDIPEY